MERLSEDLIVPGVDKGVQDRAFRLASAFVRPVRFAGGEYLWGYGTCTIVKLNGRYYAVTARHVVDRQQANFEDARILMPDTSISLPLLGHFCPRSEVMERHHLDVLIYILDDQVYFEHTGSLLQAIDLDTHLFPAKHFPAAQVVVLGYPATEDRYDYDRKILVDHLLLKYGNIESSEMEEPMYRLLSHASEYPFNGMSGSPVLGVMNQKVLFVGVVVRGTESSGIFHFIDSAVIAATIIQHQNDLQNAANQSILIQD